MATEQERQAFGSALRRLCELRGVTAPELSRRLAALGIERTDQAVRDWQAGRYTPDRITGQKIEGILDATGELLPLLGYDSEAALLRLAAVEKEVAGLRDEVKKLLALLAPDAV